MPYDRDEAQYYGVLIRQAAESSRPEPDAHLQPGFDREVFEGIMV